MGGNYQFALVSMSSYLLLLPLAQSSLLLSTPANCHLDSFSSRKPNFHRCETQHILLTVLIALSKSNTTLCSSQCLTFEKHHPQLRQDWFYISLPPCPLLLVGIRTPLYITVFPCDHYCLFFFTWSAASPQAVFKAFASSITLSEMKISETVCQDGLSIIRVLKGLQWFSRYQNQHTQESQMADNHLSKNMI